MTDRHAESTQALQQWTSLLTPQWVVVGGPDLHRYSRTTGPNPVPHPIAVLYPQSTTEVQQIVKIASRFNVPLYPISRGKNWGYGDASPPTEGQAIIDLARMNRIEVNRESAYAVIEPGVTQGQLWDYLNQHHPDLWMDSTGAGLDASLVGNTLDHGFGHTRYGDHFLSTCGMEIVLADGRILNTGLGHFPQAKAHRVYRYGVGPFLDGLFCQSNFGVITRIGVWLMPKPTGFCAFFFSAPRDEDLRDVVDQLAPFRMQGLLTSTIHIANDLRAISARARYPWSEAQNKTPLPQALRQKLRKEHGVGAWNGLGAIYGTPASVRAIKREVRRALGRYRLKFVDDRKLQLAKNVSNILNKFGMGRGLTQLLELVEPVYGLLKGKPSNEPLAGSGWRVHDEEKPLPIDPLETPAGLLWISPILPSTGSCAQELMTLIEPVYAQFGFEPLVTFTMITERAMICVTNVSFDKRDPHQAQLAKSCYDQLVTLLLSHGYIPYRTGPHGYAKLSAHPSVFWDLARQLKQTLDPQNILSPGRYIPM